MRISLSYAPVQFVLAFVVGNQIACGTDSGGGAGTASSSGTATGSGSAGPSGTGGSGAGSGASGASSSGASGSSGASPSSGSGSSGDASGSSGSGSSGASASSGSPGASGSPDGGRGDSASMNGDLPLVYAAENTGADCSVATAFPAVGALTLVSSLPDPFLLASGTRLSTRDQWRCRRAEIASQIQHWGSGPKGAPPATEKASFAGGKLTVVVTQGSASITLASTITPPSGAGPFPVVIGMNTPTGSLPASLFAGIATMTFDSSTLVPNSTNVTRGAGTYFTMYPDTAAGAMIEWAWGVSRLIDGLHMTASTNNIDLNHIGVTGCSFQGKMALYAGAFDERIALVIPEESGGGGEAAWRVSSTMTGAEDLDHAQGTAWYSTNLKQFTNSDAPKLPYDEHELVAMVAPRAILAVENTAIAYLAPEAEEVGMRAAMEVYKALGIPDRIGYTQTAATAHCAFPSSQTPDVQAFVDKFLLGKTTNTSIAKTSFTTDITKWIGWTTPILK